MTNMIGDEPRSLESEWCGGRYCRWGCGVASDVRRAIVSSRRGCSCLKMIATLDPGRQTRSQIYVRGR